MVGIDDPTSVEWSKYVEGNGKLMQHSLTDGVAVRTEYDAEQRPAREASMAVLVERLDSLRAISDRYGLADISDKISVRKRDVSLPVMVVIAGEGNYGKSSLLNALAGRDIAPVSIVPLTWKVDVYRLSASNREYAQVRFVGEGNYREVSVEEAQNLCAKEERLIKSNPASKPKITEVIWHRTGLQIGPEICLVDTPGLEQAGLGVDITSERLVKGLGATYTVDEVWHYYYYRADVVLWTFESTKLDSKGTFDTIDQLTKLQAKQIVPVATKADKVPRERWGEIADRFKKTYGRYTSCGLGQRLFCTVCGGKSNLVGVGVKELQGYIENEIAAQAVKTKTQATYDFCRDTSSELSHVLDLSAKQLIENLRTMADTADEVALNLMRVGAEQRDQTALRVNGYMIAKAEGIREFLYPIVENAMKQRDLSSVGHHLNEYLELSNVERMLDTQLKEISSQIQSLAVALCRQRRLHRVIVGTSGRESREQFSFLIDIKDPHIPPINLGDITCNLPHIGLFDGLVRGIKNFLGMGFSMTDNENMAYQRYVEAVARRLDETTKKAHRAFHDHIRSRIGPALLEAVTASLTVSTETSVKEIVDLLRNVDQDLKQLRLFSEDGNALPTQFANWARYWIAASRDVALAKQLVMDVLWPRVAEMQGYISSYSELPEIRKEFQKGFVAAYRNTCKISCQTINQVESGTGIVSRILRAATTLLSGGARTAMATAHINQASILYFGNDNKLIDLVAIDFKGFMRCDPVLDNMEQKIAETLPDAVVNKFAIPYSYILSTRLYETLTQLESREIDASIPAIQAFGGAFSRSFGFVPFIFFTLSPVAGLVAGLATRNLVIGLIAWSAAFAYGSGRMIFSKRQLKKQLMRRTYRASLKTADRWVADASSIVARRIDETFFKQLVDKLALQLNPRPLQRVTLGELTNAKH